MKEQLYRELEEGEHIRGGDVYAKPHNEVGFDVIDMPYIRSNAYTILRPVSTETAKGSVHDSRGGGPVDLCRGIQAGIWGEDEGR